MDALPDISHLPSGARAIILRLFAENQQLRAHVAELEARLNKPKKTPKNSSIPSSQSRKGNQPNQDGSDSSRGKGKKRKAAHGKGGRPLHPDPDERIISRRTCCPSCQEPFGEDGHTLHLAYDQYELPPVKPVVTRVEIYRIKCPRCDEVSIAPVPSDKEPGSPFGKSIVSQAIYFRYQHAIGYRRLSTLFHDLSGVDISEGALSNMFQRAKPLFDDQVAAILARIRRSRIVCSDETGARMRGKNHWEWVFQNDQVCLHVIRNSRARAVVEEVMGGHRPEIWVSDLLGSQQGNSHRWQVCLAHQLRDCQYAMDAGDTVFAPRMKQLFLRACAIGRRRDDLKENTLKRYQYELEARLAKCLELEPEDKDGKRLKGRYQKHGGSLFTFVTEREVPATNNGSERDLRPSATFRKVTGGFRSDWGKDLYAGVRSVLNTARRHGISAFQVIQKVLAGEIILKPG